MKILVTGAGGFIGRNLCTYLDEYYDLLPVCSKRNKALNLNSKIALELKDSEGCINYFRKHYSDVKFHAIIHLASNLPSSLEIDNIAILLSNIQITNTILELSKMLKPTFILNFSSIAVYPNLSGNFREDSEVKPSVNTECYYGLSKLCSENILDFGLKKENIKICHIRLAQTYGEGMNETRLIPTMLKELIKYNKITVYGDGERTNVFINIDEMKEITKHFLEIMPEGIFNVGTHNLKYLEIASMLIKRFGNESSRIVKVTDGNRSKFSVDTSKLNELLKKNNINIKLKDQLI